MNANDRKRLLAQLNTIAPMAIEGAQAGQVLHECGGHRVLTSAAQEALRNGVERATGRALDPAAKKLISSAAQGGSRTLASTVTTTAGEQVARQAPSAMVRSTGRQTLNGALRASGRVIGRASVAGALIDGAIAAPGAVRAYARGEITGRDAALKVAEESAIGAVSSAAGVGATIALAALTGPVGPVLALGVFAGTSLWTRYGLKRLLTGRRVIARPALLSG